VKLPDFLQQQLKVKKGAIIRIPADHPIYEDDKYHQNPYISYHYTEDMGDKVGIHQGAHFFTIGQRKGLQVGGMEEPLFVIATDVHRNVVYTGMGDTHPGLYRRGLFIPLKDLHWVEPTSSLRENESEAFAVRIRYRQALQKATLRMKKDGLYIDFDQPQRGITPGQFAAWYQGETLLGSGVIA
jgi:tRNA-specific 2-thiouridylase